MSAPLIDYPLSCFANSFCYGRVGCLAVLVADWTSALYSISSGKKTFLPEELSSFILRQLLDDAQKFLGEPITEAIISVPAYFNANQRAATKLAGKLSGVKVDRLINEPSAAALACRNWNDDETFIVIDFGGGTLDVSIVEAFDNVINICAVSGNNFLGGIDFDQAVANAVCTEYDIDMAALSNYEYQILLKAAEFAKIQLGYNDESVISVTLQGKRIEFPLTGNDFFHLSQQILERLKKPIQLAVQDSGLSVSDIDKCILVGGSCHMPIVQDFLNSLLRVPVTYSEEADKIVALGLGTYAGIKQRVGEVKDLVLTDICPFSLNIDVYNEANPAKSFAYTMIPRNTVLPTSRLERLYTVQPGQTKIRLQISQGEEMYADDNIFLGKLDVKVPRNKKDIEEVDVTFTYDINAILAVQAKVISTGEQYQLILAGKGLSVSESQLEVYIKNIQNYRLAHYERIDLIRERTKRIYTEIHEDLKPLMQEIVQSLDKMGTSGSIRKVIKRLDEIEKYLDELEKNLDGTDIFNDMSTFLRLIQGDLDE